MQVRAAEKCREGRKCRFGGTEGIPFHDFKGSKVLEGGDTLAEHWWWLVGFMYFCCCRREGVLMRGRKMKSREVRTPKIFMSQQKIGPHSFGLIILCTADLGVDAGHEGFESLFV